MSKIEDYVISIVNEEVLFQTLVAEKEDNLFLYISGNYSVSPYPIEPHPPLIGYPIPRLTPSEIKEIIGDFGKKQKNGKWKTKEGILTTIECLKHLCENGYLQTYQDELITTLSSLLKSCPCGGVMSFNHQTNIFRCPCCLEEKNERT